MDLMDIKGYFFFFFCLFAISWAAPAAYGGSQARGPIEAIATGVHHSHSNAGSKPLCNLHCSFWQCQILNPLSKARDGTCILRDAMSGPYPGDPPQALQGWAMDA